MKAIVLTTLYLVGGGSATPSYIFFASLEVASMTGIVCFVWRQLGRTV